MIKKIILFLCISSICLSLLSCTKVNNILDENSKDCISEEKYYNDYTGLECSKEEKDNPAFMIMIENSTSARPQSGLSYADILYETSAEGGIPRFLAVFSTNLPSTIGPVRSIRPYFISIIKEFNLPFAHCGGSAEALNTINSDSSLMSINEINQGNYFWRDSSRKAPHNLYTSSDNIKKYIKDKNIPIKNSQFSSFDKNYFDNESLKPAKEINIQVNRVYNTSYVFEDGSYFKSMDSKKAIDAINNEQLNFTNIVVQKTPITLSNDNSHLNINLIGEGEGLVFSKGKMIEINWKRDSETDNTSLYDKNGNKVYLSPGKTMWNIIDTKSNIEINN